MKWELSEAGRTVYVLFGLRGDKAGFPVECRHSLKMLIDEHNEQMDSMAVGEAVRQVALDVIAKEQRVGGKLYGK